MSIGVDFVLRASTAAFTAGLATAKNGVLDLKKSFKAMDLGSIGRMIGVGGIVHGLMSAVEHARNLAEEAGKIGEKVDSSVMALVRFGDTMSGLKGVGVSAFGSIASLMEQIGMRAGALVYGWDAAADAAGAMAKEAAAAAKAMTDEKLTAALKDLAKFREESGYKRASDEDKINLLLAKQVELLRQQNEARKDPIKSAQIQLEIEKNRVELGDVSARIEKERAKASEDLAKQMDEAVTRAEQERLTREQTLAAEQEQVMIGYEREAQLKAQNAELEAQERRLSKMLALSQMLNAAGGSAFNDASDEALRERLRRSQQTVINQQNSLVGKDNSVGSMIVGADIGRLQVEIQNIKAELAVREQLRRDFAMGGEAAARRNFKGDPLEFDRVFQQLVADTRDTKQIQSETLTQLREINQRQKSGIAVVNLNSK